MFEKIPENVQIDSEECTRVFRGSNVFTFKLIKATSFLKWPPAPASSASKGNSKFEILLAKISLNKKQVKYFQLLQKKSHFVSSRKKAYVALDKRI